MLATPSPGVGDPCLCGSGLAFGVCCRAEFEASLAVWRTRRAAEARLVRAILDYGYARCGPRLFLHAWDLFTMSEILPGDRDRHREQFEYWFVFAHVANIKETTIDFGYPADWPYRPLAAEWLDADGRDASEADRALVSRLLASPWSLLVFERVTTGWSTIVRDLMTGRRMRVIDPEISSRARPDEVLLSAVVTSGGVSTFAGPATHAMPPAFRAEAGYFRRQPDFSGEWLTRAQVAEEWYDFFSMYHKACVLSDGPYAYLRHDDDPILEPCHFRWRLTLPFLDALEQLRPLTSAFDDHAIDLEPGPDGDARAMLTWYRQNDPDDCDDCEALAYLFLEEGVLSGDVATRAQGRALLEAIESHLGPAAVLVEARPCRGLSPLRADQRDVIVGPLWF